MENEQVGLLMAYERRFPSCPQIPVVVECVITADSWSADDSQRDTSRRCQLNVEAPYLLKKMVGVDYVYFMQTNHLDLKERVLEIEAINETFSSRVEVLEKCRYYVHPENPQWTCFEQSALLDVKNFFGLESTVEKIAMKQYSSNIAKGKELIESFMKEVEADGIHELKPWKKDDPAHNRELRRIVSRNTEPLSPRANTEPTRLSQPGTSRIRQSGFTFRSSSNTSKFTSTSPTYEGEGGWRTVVRKQDSDIPSPVSGVPSPPSDIQSPPSDASSALKFRPPPKSTSRIRQSGFTFRSSSNTSKFTSTSPTYEGEGGWRTVVRKQDSDIPSPVSGVPSPPSDIQSPPSDASSALKFRPPPKNQYTLDSEYIKRYLGELTPMQESRLLQLRKWIADLQKGKVPSDTTLLRFLRARDFSVEKSREMLSQSLLWRKRHQVDRLLAEYEAPPVVAQYFPGGWHHHDKDGRPLYILRLGQMDVKGLLKSVGEDGLLKLTLHVCEEGLKLLEEATRSSEHAVHSWCLLVDLDGLNMRHLWRPGVRALLRIIQIVEANYPETMGRVLIVRAPRVFPILWTIVSTFIDENTRSKFLFYGGKDYLQPGGLLDYIPKDLIPDFLGGPCKSFVYEGGLVPKSLYVSGAFTERDGEPLCEDSIYRSVSLSKGQVHEVIVANSDPGSVLTWDFDVLRHDVGFTVFRSPHDLSQDMEIAAGCAGGEEVTSALAQAEWREGEHYHKVEPTLVAHDGESIQGSHVMLERGSYVLQWRCEPLDHARAQLMYFHETLASHHYKKSMRYKKQIHRENDKGFHVKPAVRSFRLLLPQHQVCGELVPLAVRARPPPPRGHRAHPRPEEPPEGRRVGTPLETDSKS
ncbi:hypothetical protein MSG28_010514 [Choristoneura fumiferana]|uniref:Uncharacterized protein n=1 Tax=Choristoneura fumiferana TaxID=7141 RepID=A0ACC0KLV8_CHOFU|nr:hypothetical protein MSG28_010514 [Choristoneura fumiferana]